MNLVHAVLAGIGGLILVYLLVKNGDNFVKILNSGGGVLVKETTTLQGR